MDCIFCKIIAESIPSYTIYDDETVKVFLDINPDSNGHLLIVPKKHITDISDMDEKTMLKIFQTAQIMKKILEEKLHIDGLTLIQNNGCIQEVKHFHLHLKPVYKSKQDLKSVEEVYNILKNTKLTQNKD